MEKLTDMRNVFYKPCLQGAKQVDLTANFGKPLLPIYNEGYQYFGLTLNPLRHRRITCRNYLYDDHRGQPTNRSRCLKYSNYGFVDQRFILDEVLRKIKSEVDLCDNVFYEKTQDGDLHWHTTFRCTHPLEYDVIAKIGDELKKTMGNKELTYVPLDIKCIHDNQTLHDWSLYIRKDMIDL